MFRPWYPIPILALCGILLPAPRASADPAAGASVPVATSDWVFGNGTPGPFPLSWTAVEFASERVSVNGTRLIPELDYRLDGETGSLMFSQPLAPGQIVMIEYRYDPARARSNPRAAPVALSMPLWEAGSGGVQMIGAVQPGAGAGQAPAASVLGFRGETALGGSQITSLFLLAPAADGHLNASHWQRAALQLGASRTKGPFQFRAAISQAGTGFGPAGDYQLPQGMRRLDLSAAFSPSKHFSITSQVQRQDALAGGQKGSEQASMRVGVEAQAAPQLHMRAGLSRQDSAKDGRSDTVTLGLDAGLKQALALQGSFSQTRAQATGTDATSNLKLTLRPAAQLGFRIGFDQHLTRKQGGSSGADWGITAGRNGLLTVEGQNTESTPAAGPKEQNEQLRIETSPVRGFKVSSLTVTKQVGQDAARQTHETSLELSPLGALKVTGALRDEETAGGVVHVRSVSGVLKPAAFLDLSGTYQMHDLPVGDNIVTRALQLALTPVRGLKLEGGYTENPEGDDGQVLPTTDTSLGLESTIGSFVFGGSYSVGAGDPASAGSGALRQREQAEIRLGLNLWRHTRLYSNYKESEERAGALTLNRTLSLGFRRALSQNFYLLLEGDLTEVQIDGVPQPGMSDERAQANLAMRF